MDIPRHSEAIQTQLDSDRQDYSERLFNTADLLLFIRRAVNNFWVSLEEQRAAENLLIRLI